MALLDTPIDPASYTLPDSIPADEVAMNEREKALRDLFVSEYMIDYDQIKAAQRCGFHQQFAIEYGKKFMEEPYVQKRINEIKFADTNPAELAKFDKKRIKAALMYEAHYRGPGSSASARVAALGKLALLEGMEAPKKTENTHVHRGGVMAVPGIANLEQWEATASASQDKLVTDATNGAI